MSTSGDIMMHVGEQVGENLSISIENPNVLNIPQCAHHIPPMYSWYCPDVLNWGMFSTSGVFSTSGGYHEYIGGIS